MAKDKLKIDVSWINYSNNDKDKIKFTSDQSFVDVVKQNKTVRTKVIAIAIILFIVLI